MGEIWSGERYITAEVLRLRIARAAAGLATLGVGPGDAVALYLRNDIAFFEASFAVGEVGAYAVPVNWHYKEDEAAYLFENSGARVIIIHADLYAPIKAVIPGHIPVLVVPTPPEIARSYGLTAGECEIPNEMINWNSWVDGFSPRLTPAGEAPGTIIYTSGTTGRPKGVLRAPPTTEQAQNFLSVLKRGFFGVTPDTPNTAEIITVMTGPMYHSAPSSYGRVAALLNATVIVQPRFDPEELLQMIETRRVTHLHMVPIMFARLLKLPDVVKQRYDLSSLQYVVHAAAPCPAPMKRAMIEWWGPIIHEYYGATETGMVVVCSSSEWLSHPGTVGRAFPEASVRVIDSNGNVLPPREVGEVICKLNGIADFTYRGDDEKRRATEKQGLIAPGDIGYLDEDGFLYLCDRSKDMLISGGVNIYPAEIEAELHKMPGVADCGVFGIPDEEYGEAVCAVVQPMPGVTLTESGVRAYLRERIAGYKVPKRVDFHVELPREDSGKIFKRKLREPFWIGLNRDI